METDFQLFWPQKNDFTLKELWTSFYLTIVASFRTSYSTTGLQGESDRQAPEVVQSASPKTAAQHAEHKVNLWKTRNVFSPLSHICWSAPLFCVCVRSESVSSLLLLLCTGPCSSKILLHSVLHLSFPPFSLLPPESKGFYQGAPARPDITSKGSVVVVEVRGGGVKEEEEEEEGGACPCFTLLEFYEGNPLLSSPLTAQVLQASVHRCDPARKTGKRL